MKDNDKGVYIALSLVAFSFLMLFFPFSVLNNIGSENYKIKISNYDELGEFVGGITAPFLSLAAFILLYLTYKSQKEELSNTQDILKEQNTTQQTQRFETTFFNLVNLHHSVVNNIELTLDFTETDLTRIRHNTTEVKNGRDCFLTFYARLRTEYKGQKAINPQSRKSQSAPEIETIEKAYHIFFKRHQYHLGHYFRNLYHLIKFIDKSEVQDKQMYVSLVRAQLSSHELLLIFYNCSTTAYGGKFTQYMTKYHFLKNMPVDELLNPTHKDFYPDDAYNS